MAHYDNFGNRRKGKHGADLYKLDTKTKTSEENIRDILQGLYVNIKQNDSSPTNKSIDSNFGFKGLQRNGSDGRRLSYLNALVTLLAKEDRNNLGFTADELMTCIRISLVDDSMVIRAAALRVLRYLIKTESDVATFNNLKLPYLVIRSMDLMLRNEEERAQALRVVRRVVAVVGASGQIRRYRAAYVDSGLLRCLTAVAKAGSAGDGTGDRLSRPAIATLAEICVLNPDMFISCGGVNAVTRQLAECATPRMAEALCGVLLHTLNNPVSRRLARIDLMCLSSPYCDFHFRPAGTETSRDEREMRFTCSRLALLCVLRSWPGLLHFCHPYSAGGLRALVAALYLPRLEVRKAILDLLYELVGLPQPEWTDEISVALGAVDPSDFQDSWRLNEGFVAEEGIAILPHLGATGADITEMHLALLLQCFLEAGLLEGLAEVIVTSDTFISVRATVLLGQLVQLSCRFVPGRAGGGAAALGALAAQAAAGRPQALAAVAALRRLHATLAQRPAAASLFLDHILQYCSGAFRPPPDEGKTRKEKDNAVVAHRHSVGSRPEPAREEALPKSRSVSSRTSAAVTKVTKYLFDRDGDALLRATLVIPNKDGNTWNWEIIRAVLKENDDAPILNLNDSVHKGWAARIINYLKPSSNKYSHADLSSTCHGHAATRAGCQLIRHLLKHNDADSQKLLESLFNDVSRQIEAIETGLKAHECLFSPQHMCNTMCQMYFLFIGQLCHTQAGLKLFKQSRLYENLLELSTKTHHSCYVKLVISSLDYTLDSYPRDILAKTLTCNIQASRLYTTQFLNVLLRASRKSRELVRRKSKFIKNYDHKMCKDEIDSCGDDMETWILKMLVGQVKDECKEIVKTALDILEEACTVPAFVDKMMTLKNIFGQNCGLDKNVEPSSLDFNVVGDRAYLLWLNLEATAAGQAGDCKSLAFLKKHLDFWTKSYNYRYVLVVEGRAQSALRGAGGGAAPARPPAHLLAALPPAQPRARALLHAALADHYKVLQRKRCSTDREVADLKAALWALGNAALTPRGLRAVASLGDGRPEESVPAHAIRVAGSCPVYAVRAAAFYVLGLIGSTREGADLLSELGWMCVRHTRHEQFPVLGEEGAGEGGARPPERAGDGEASELSDRTDPSLDCASTAFDCAKVGRTSPLDLPDRDLLDHKPYADKKDRDKRKSHTLPSHGCSSSQDRPTLSESKTVDMLRDFTSYERQPHRMTGENRLLIGRMNSLEYAYEGRVRNTSESSTSGVSSCDSFLGKYAIPDRVLTLSPIPSSSSLYGMKSSISSQRPRISELQRRTSTSSFTGHEGASSPPSQMDMTGYATLKSINRRPHLSESAATGSSDIDDLSWLLTDSNRRQKPFSSLRDRAKSTRERINKMSLLEYDWKPLGVWEVGAGAGAGAGARGAAGGGSARPPPAPCPDHPAYIGIALPRDLMDIFPREEGVKEEELDKGDPLKRTRLPSFLADASVASVDKSRATPDSQKFSSRGMASARGNFAAASTPNSNKIKSDPRVGSKTDVNIEGTVTKEKNDIEETNEKSDDTIKNDTSDSDFTKTEDNTDVSKTNVDSSRMGTDTSDKNVICLETQNKVWRHATADCLACARIRPPSSHELREAFFADMDVGVNAADARSQSDSTAPEKCSPQTQLLNQVHSMSNPLHLRQTRSVLLALKQRHPEVFRSACVYSEVMALVSRDTYLLCARRFLQELFLDVSFECFAPAAAALLARRAPPPPQR